MCKNVTLSPMIYIYILYVFHTNQWKRNTWEQKGVEEERKEKRYDKRGKNPVSHQRKDETFCNLEQSVTSD